MKFFFIFLNFSLAGRPEVPILNQENVEIRKDVRYSMTVEKIRSLEHLHILKLPILEKPENYYLLHQTDFCTLYNHKENRLSGTYATIQGPVNPFETKLFRHKKKDPRSKTWNNAKVPLFTSELSSSKSDAIETWISTNMIDINQKGYQAFITYVLSQIIGELKVNMVILPIYTDDTTNVEKLEFYITYLELDQKTSFGINAKDLVEDEIRLNAFQWFIKSMKSLKTNRMLAFRSNVHASALWQNINLEKSPRYSTEEPNEFLCANDGRYSPWFATIDEQWNRCGKSPTEDDLELTAICHCDSGCFARKDCCTDYMQSCQDSEDWKTRECVSEENFVCPLLWGEEPATILISTDGFRKHYLEKNITPNIQKIRDCGSTAKFMQASYPTKTFPNHNSLMTGLHPSQHGIVDNDWFDWQKKAKCSVFSVNTGQFPCNVSSDDEHWWKGDPFWNVVERHDKVAAALLWPGNELVINGERPTHHWDYGIYGEGPFAERVYQLLKWLNLPKWDGKQETKAESRPNFMTLYMDEPDHAGHSHGAYDETGELDSALIRVDTIMGMLMDGLKMYGFDKCVNIIHTADHGMETALCAEIVALAPIANDELVDTYIGAKSTTGSLSADRDAEWGSDFDIQAGIDKFQCTHNENNLRTFDKYLMPKRLHVDTTTQIETVLFLMDRYNKTTYTPRNPCSDEGYMGTHGWDNKYDGMHVPLNLLGPSFKQGIELPVLQNVEIFKLMMDLVGIPADSPKLMKDVMDSQFSLFGKFDAVLKEGINKPEVPDYTEIKYPFSSLQFTDCGTLDSAIDSTIYFDLNTGSSDYAQKVDCLKNKSIFATNLDAPFWWDSFVNILLDNLTSKSKYLRIQLGSIFDVTGGGIHRDSADWSQGYNDSTWCHFMDDQNKPTFVPSHLYMILTKESPPGDGDVFSALLPYRIDGTQIQMNKYTECTVCNTDECRATYPADFNCGIQNLKDDNDWLGWWNMQMDLHSAKVIEIERASGIQFFGTDEVSSDLDRVNIKTAITSFGDFCNWLNDSFDCSYVPNLDFEESSTSTPASSTTDKSSTTSSATGCIQTTGSLLMVLALTILYF